MYQVSGIYSVGCHVGDVVMSTSPVFSVYRKNRLVVLRGREIIKRRVGDLPAALTPFLEVYCTREEAADLVRPQLLSELEAATMWPPERVFAK